MAASLANGACGSSSQSLSQPEFIWTLSPAASTVGQAVLRIELLSAGKPATRASLKLAAMMSHAGMAPVTATATEPTPGRYEVPFTFTMQGDWILLVVGTLPDGTRIDRRIDVPNVRPAG